MEGGDKMKSWKKQFKKEIAMHTPELKDEVKKFPIPMEVKEKEKPKKNIFKLYWTLPSAALAILILFFCLWFFLKPVNPSSPQVYVYTLDINPSFIFVTDEEGTVTSASSLNEDADVVLSSLDSLRNIHISKAMTACIDSAARLGYFEVSKQGDAVLVRGLKEDESQLLNSIASSIQAYFCEKGFYGVYIEERMSLVEFCQDLGVPSTSDIHNFLNHFEEIESLYGNRGANENNIASLYEDYIIGTQLLDFMRVSLKRNLNLIYDNATMILNIASLNAKIMVHEENPALFLKDYWSVKLFSDKNYTNSFAEVMEEMDALLDEYEKSFGSKLQSLQDVTSLLESYKGISLEDIKDLENLSVVDFLNHPERYISILKNIGEDVSELEGMLIPPTSIEEYQAQLQKVLTILANQKKLEFKEIYEETRSSIDEISYENYIKNIEKEYGSLLNYWNSQKK